jgi:ADP-heptose:LPS heptosyltransferase
VNVVLTRLDRVGDLILSTPAIASVRRSWPQAHVTIVCSAHNASVMEHNPDVDEIAILPPDAHPAKFGRRFRGRCDIAIALAPRAPDYSLVGATRAPIRVGYTYVRRYAARLTSRFFLNRTALSDADPALSERLPSRPVRHEVDQVLDLVALAGGQARDERLVVPIEEADRAAVAHVPGGGIAFHLGLRWIKHGSTLESATELIGELRRFGLPVIVTYGNDALEQADAVRRAGVADAMAGGLSFGEWAAVFEKCRLVVTVDTGATHVASATRRPTVVLFEHRYFNLSSREWSPYRVPSVCLRKPPSESPADLAASHAEVLGAVESLLALEAAASSSEMQHGRPT